MMVVVFGSDGRGRTTLVVQQLYLTRCRMDPAPLTRLLDASTLSLVHMEIAAQAIFGGVDDDAMKRMAAVHAEYTVEAAAGTSTRYVSQLARFLSTGQHRRGRRRATHVPLWLQEFVQCDSAQQLMSKYPLHQYTGDDP